MKITTYLHYADSFSSEILVSLTEPLGGAIPAGRFGFRARVSWFAEWTINQVYSNVLCLLSIWQSAFYKARKQINAPQWLTIAGRFAVRRTCKYVRLLTGAFHKSSKRQDCMQTNYIAYKKETNFWLLVISAAFQFSRGSCRMFWATSSSQQFIVISNEEWGVITFKYHDVIN